MLFNTQQSLKQIIKLASKELERADLFFGHGTDNPWDEACWLVESLAQGSGHKIINADMRLDEALLKQIHELLMRRIDEKVPLAYLLNEAWFAGLPFYVNNKVLIPRSPIAELIKNRFEPLIKHEPKTILDLCCGSGCIGLASALEFTEAKLVLADLSVDALQVAAVNIEKHHLCERSLLQQSDLYSALEGSFDLIISNPPYVGKSEYQTLPEEYKHEPAMALLSEHNGLAIPIEILRQSANYLNEGGVLILEVGNGRYDLEELYPEVSFLWLDLEYGGEGILSISKEQLQNQRF